MARDDVKGADAFVVTGPTSGIGLRVALELAAQGPVILVGRKRAKLDAVRGRIEASGGRAASIVGDLSDVISARHAAAQVAALGWPIRAVLNNAGVMMPPAARTAQGWDPTFATNHLGPFAFTEALAPHLADGTQVAFVVSAIEDPERRPARVMGMRGGRYLSAEASARGEWEPGGCRLPGVDAYATSKQCALAATLGLSRELPRLAINAIEPGITPGTGLGGGNAVVGFIFGQIVTRLPPFRRYRSTPERAARMITRLLTDRAPATGVYFDERGEPMRGSARAHDAAFQARVLRETRALLAEVAGVPG